MSDQDGVKATKSKAIKKKSSTATKVSEPPSSAVPGPPATKGLQQLKGISHWFKKRKSHGGTTYYHCEDPACSGRARKPRHGPAQLMQPHSLPHAAGSRRAQRVRLAARSGTADPREPNEALPRPAKMEGPRFPTRRVTCRPNRPRSKVSPCPSQGGPTHSDRGAKHASSTRRISERKKAI